ncbi:MAG: hemolysin family protein [Dysgonomonas sp.]|nr:hemolysin family protein [Dysgonomonas sp.]
MALLFLYLFIALFTSFLCSIMESVLLSTPYTYLKAKAENGDKPAITFLKLKTNIDKPLSAILSLNTVAHTVGAAGVGAQATIVFGEAYFGVVSAILTILILVLTEIIPKTLGANYSKNLVGISATIIKGMIIITYPLVVISAYLTRLLSKKEVENTTSREEISTLANIGTQEGIFGEKENIIIQNLIRLNEVKISEVMTPRTVAVMADEEMSLSDFLKNKQFLHFSRIPVYSGDKDNVTGYVFRTYVFEKLAEDQFNLSLKDIRRDITTLYETTSLYNAWEKLLENREQIALILNEYGGVDGIVTMEDIIETLLGFEIVDEKDKVADMQQYALERWKARQRKYDFLSNDEE